MTNPTSNFGWQMPTSTDLVTDLPADFEVFGQAVDTSLADLKGGTTGQVLKKNTNADMDFVWSADAAGMTNPMTTTGDTIYSSSGSTPARLGIGTSGQVLSVSGGVPAWTTPAAAGSLTLLSTTTLSGTSVSVTSISQSYTDLRILIKGAYATGQDDMRLRFNSDTSGNYSYYNIQVANNTVTGNESTTSQIYFSQIDSTNTYVWNNYTIIDLPRYKDTSKIFGKSSARARVSSATTQIECFFAYNNSAAITSVQLSLSAQTFSGGTMYIYGVN